MITLPSNTRIWIAAGITDMRKGFTGLSALIQTALEQDPFSGHVFVFRGRRGDLIKLIFMTAMVCACLRSVWDAGASYGRKPKAELSR
jgi:transposase